MGHRPTSLQNHLMIHPQFFEIPCQQTDRQTDGQTDKDKLTDGDENITSLVEVINEHNHHSKHVHSNHTIIATALYLLAVIKVGSAF